MKLPESVVKQVPCKGYLDIACLDDERAVVFDFAGVVHFVDFASGHAKAQEGSCASTAVVNEARDRLLLDEGIVDAKRKVITKAKAELDWNEPMALSPDSKLIACKPDYKTFALRRADTGKIVFSDEVPNGIDSAQFSPDGTFVLLARAKQPLRIYPSSGGGARVLADTKRPAYPRLVRFHPDGSRVLDVDRSKTIVVRATDTWQPVFEVKLSSTASSAAWVPRSPWFVATTGSRLSLFDGRTGKLQSEIALGGGAVRVVAASPSGRRIVTAGEGQGVLAWDVEKLTSSAPAVKAKQAKPTSAKPGKLRGVFFGVDAKLPKNRLVAAAKSLHHILDNQPAEFAVVIERDGAGKQLRWLTFLASRGRNYLREPWIECLHVDLGPIVVALVDDDNRICLFERYRSLAPDLSIVSHRFLVGVNAGKLEATGPQSKLTNKQLMAAWPKTAAQRSPQEHLAIERYATAIDLGLAQLYPKDSAAVRYRTLREAGEVIFVTKQQADVDNLVGRVEILPGLDRWPKSLPCDYNRFSK